MSFRVDNNRIKVCIIFFCVFCLLAFFFYGIAVESDPVNLFKTTTYIFTAKIHRVFISDVDPTLHLYSSEEFMKRKAGDVFIAGIDAKWAVELEVISAEGEDRVLNEGERIVFVIHSPIRNIGVSYQEAIGKEVGLEMVISRSEDGQLCFDLFPSWKKKVTLKE